MHYFILLICCLILSGSWGFKASIQCETARRQVLNMHESGAAGDLSRHVKKGMRYLTSFVAAGLIAAAPVMADSLEEANSKLSGYGFPPILYVPGGFSPLVSEFGRGNIREEMKNPILVQFAYPNLWVVQKTSVNVNGEAGTISANDYIKGDSAFLYVLPSKEKLTAENSKELVRKFILKSLSQKGDPVESLKIFKILPSSPGVDGQQYFTVDFEYQLNTEAGFLIGRRAVASLTSAGEGYVQGLVAVTTDKRWGKGGSGGMEGKLRTIADSFRVYRLNSGIFSATP